MLKVVPCTTYSAQSFCIYVYYELESVIIIIIIYIFYYIGMYIRALPQCLSHKSQT